MRIVYTSRLTVSAADTLHVEALNIPMLVHVATNDQDVNYVEDQQLVRKPRALEPSEDRSKPAPPVRVQP